MSTPIEDLEAARAALILKIGTTREWTKFQDKEYEVEYSDSLKTIAWYDAEIARLTAAASGPAIRCTLASFRND